MSRRRGQRGYILPVTLLILSCTLLWGSTLLLTLSDQYAASNDLVKQEQSRLLARSGWNLAVHQLHETGITEDMHIQKEAGQMDVVLQPHEDDSLIDIQVSAEADGCLKKITGTVQLLEYAETETTTPSYLVQVVERNI